jgi:putative Mn2+ efflux pump MntP
MPFCSKCGKEVEGTDKYCNSCGQGIKGTKKLKLKYAGMLLGIMLGMIVTIVEMLLMVIGDKTGNSLQAYVGQLESWLAFAGVPCAVIGFAIGAVIDQFRD